MLGTVIRKEIVSHVLSLRFAAAFILILTLVFASIYVSVNEYRQNVLGFQARTDQHERDVKEILEEDDEWHRHRRLFDWEGKRDAVPVAPLSWIGQGLQPSLPTAINTRTHQQRSLGVGVMRNPLRGLLRLPDFVYVVNVVLSFLAVLFMFDSVCGEKEAGTLRLTLSNAVPRHTLLLGKWIGGYVVLIIPFLVATGGALIFAYVSQSLQVGQMGRVAVLMAIACLYVAVFFNVALFVSTLCARAATSLLSCLLIWVLFILVIPNMAPVTAQILEPTPPIETVRAEKRAIDQEIRLRKERLTLTSGEAYYGRKVNEERAKLDRELDRRKNRWDRYYRDGRARQIDLAKTLGRISPSGCWTYAALALAGTGPTMHDRLERAQETLMSDYKRKADELMKRSRSDNPANRSRVSLEELPRLRTTFLSMSEALDSSLNDMLVLVILNILFFMLGFTMFLRYDVR